MWLDVPNGEAAARDDLMDQLRAAGVRYLGGGHGPAKVTRGKISSSEDLILGLVQSSDPRLRTALIALLLHQPSQATTALRLVETLDDPRTILLIQASALAAAALQRT